MGSDLLYISHFFLHVLGTQPQAGGAVGQSLLTWAVLQGHHVLSCVPWRGGLVLHEHLFILWSPQAGEGFLCSEMGWEADVTFKNIINTWDSTYTWILFGVTARSVLEAGQLDWILSWIQENPGPTLIKSTEPNCRINVKVKHEQVWGCHANSHCHLLRDKCMATEHIVFMCVHGITENKTIHFSFLIFPNVFAA